MQVEKGEIYFDSSSVEPVAEYRTDKRTPENVPPEEPETKAGNLRGKKTEIEF